MFLRQALEALGIVGPLDDRGRYERTTVMYVVNDAPTAAIKICFMQATSRMTILPPPYITDTGTFIAGSNLPAGQNINVDPWDAGGRNAPIAATAGSCTLTVVLAPGVEQTIPLTPYPEAAEGHYYPSMGWRITSAPAAADGTPSLLVVPIPANEVPLR